MTPAEIANALKRIQEAMRTLPPVQVPHVVWEGLDHLCGAFEAEVDDDPIPLSDRDVVWNWLKERHYDEAALWVTGNAYAYCVGLLVGFVAKEE